jgi:hypothetical protein
MQEVKVDGFGVVSGGKLVGGRLVIKCVRAVPAHSWHGEKTVLTRLITNHFFLVLRSNYTDTKALFFGRGTSHDVKMSANTRLILANP